MYSTSSLKLTLEQKQAHFTNPYHHCHHDIVHHVTKMCPRVRKTMPHHMFTITSSSPWPSSTSSPFIFQPIENNGFIQKPSHNSSATSPIKHSVQHVEEVIEQVYMHIHTYIHTYIHTCTHTYMHTYIHTCTRTYIHTYIHTTYIHTYIIYIRHIHSYTHHIYTTHSHFYA